MQEIWDQTETCGWEGVQDSVGTWVEKMFGLKVGVLKPPLKASVNKWVLHRHVQSADGRPELLYHLKGEGPGLRCRVSSS